MTSHSEGSSIVSGSMTFVPRRLNHKGGRADQAVNHNTQNSIRGLTRRVFKTNTSCNLLSQSPALLGRGSTTILHISNTIIYMGVCIYSVGHCIGFWIFVFWGGGVTSSEKLLNPQIIQAHHVTRCYFKGHTD
ncbi:hypothetical protein GDO81_006922 [Engystomops pustulosus]|uniref:Uncharacterized protein n=1 Tax=Engystomops pustulosus TaxID=76066 RepID=A0AAV7D2C7_ENGPU|nr:hypothetical protein GDO81_006922 [Engystomops pustulosus]